VNDTFGHAVGDALLVAVADLLRDEAPKPALPARLGGDEFAILLPDIGNADAAMAVARQIQRRLQTPIEVIGCGVSVGATIGIAIGPGDGRRAEDLIHAADLAMYEAKRGGKGSVKVFERQTERGPPALAGLSV
jgi:diguanylate cyclase (GGDEF)-like protein